MVDNSSEKEGTIKQNGSYFGYTFNLFITSFP